MTKEDLRNKKLENDIREFRYNIESCKQIKGLLLNNISLKEYEELINPHNYLDKVEAQNILEISNTLPNYDGEIYKHGVRVGAFSFLIAKKLQLENYKLFFLAGLLHDTGKILIPRKILYKPGSLTNEECEIIREHPNLGFKLLSRSGVKNHLILDAIMHHHTNYDGKKGYPKVNREAILKGTRLVSIADAFDSMANERPYSKAMPLEDIQEELIRCSGTQFDPNFAKVFIVNLPTFYRTIHPEKIRKVI